MADSIRGNGLLIAHDALQKLIDDPQRLDRARSRFSGSPPSYRSLSGTTTRSQSPNPSDEETLRLEKQWYQLEKDYRASFPSDQFDAEMNEEKQRILAADYTTSTIPGVLVIPNSNVIKLARETVKKRWVEQGIWNEKWKEMNPWNDDTPSGPWKHEKPLELEFETENISTRTILEGAERMLSPPPKSDVELRLIAQRRLVREREREASRPFHQFLYQVSKQRERLQSEPAGPEGALPLNLADINSKAYENVKSIWTERGIWNKKWGILPGMSWKHEQPLEEALAEEMGADYPRLQSLRKRNDNEVTETRDPPENILGSLPRAQPPSQPPCQSPCQSPAGSSAEPSARPLFQPPPPQLPVQPSAQSPAQSPVESNTGLALGLANTSRGELPASPGPIGLQNNDTNHTSSAPHSPSSSTESTPDYHVATGQTPRRIEDVPSERNEQARSTAGTTLGPIHQAKVTKAPRRKETPGPRRRGGNASRLRPDAQPSLPELDSSEPHPPPDSASPRRSVRLRALRPDASTDQAAVASAGPSNVSSQPRGRKTTVGNPNSSGLTRPSGCPRDCAEVRRNQSRSKMGFFGETLFRYAYARPLCGIIIGRGSCMLGDTR